MNLSRCHLLFKGAVQGVGFRYTARHIARSLGITGYVKNLYSGDVEVVAESDAASIHEFAKEMRNEMSGYIRDVEMDWAEYKGEFSEFGVRF